MPRRAETHRARAANTLRFTPVSFITADMLARLSAPVCLYYCHFYSALHNNVLSSRERKSSERSCVEKCHGKSKETESGLFHANFKVSCGIRRKKGDVLKQTASRQTARSGRRTSPPENSFFSSFCHGNRVSWRTCLDCHHSSGFRLRLCCQGIVASRSSS
ncbi:hypothetical protein AMELA_G00272200 [Ameiurus melas]|uniref:Uncharacterized protein n=1 Tax=Ameiurus melas TaxID=219545 RepID=A0A7J5ZL31_AMEME|nr:hypothetical protein AMELA_G00272200 [Ameiurus melas]